MKRFIILALLLSVAPVSAQQAYTAPDEDVWNAMVRALGDVPMSIGAHNSVQNILRSAQQESLARASRQKAIDRSKKEPAAADTRPAQ
jgi:hypothetical protein